MAKQYYNWKGELVVGCPKGEGNCWEPEHLTKEQIEANIAKVSANTTAVESQISGLVQDFPETVTAEEYINSPNEAELTEAPVFKETNYRVSWQEMSKIPNAETLYQSPRNSGDLSVRQSGKIYQIKTDRSIQGRIKGTPEEVAQQQEALLYGLSDAELRIGEEAVGGGQGHYDYDIVTSVTGWRTMTPEEVTAWKQILELKKGQRKVEREISGLEKQIQALKKSIGRA